MSADVRAELAELVRELLNRHPLRRGSLLFSDDELRRLHHGIRGDEMTPEQRASETIFGDHNFRCQRPQMEYVVDGIGIITYSDLAARYRAEIPAAASAPRCWIQTRGGGALDLLNPTPDMIDLAAVGAVLARIPRFGGHTEGDVIYSVAQHSVEGAAAVLRDTGNRRAAAAFLLHDAHEAYIGDIATPVQMALEDFGTDYDGVSGAVSYAFTEIKRTLDAAIYARADIPYPLPPDIAALVKSYDIRMCRTERDARLAPAPYAWGPTYDDAAPVAGADVTEWPYRLAVAMWGNACAELLNIR